MVGIKEYPRLMDKYEDYESRGFTRSEISFLMKRDKNKPKKQFPLEDEWLADYLEEY